MAARLSDAAIELLSSPASQLERILTSLVVIVFVMQGLAASSVLWHRVWLPGKLSRAEKRRARQHRRTEFRYSPETTKEQQPTTRKEQQRPSADASRSEFECGMREEVADGSSNLSSVTSLPTSEGGPRSRTLLDIASPRDQSECVVCLDRPRSHVLVPCGHCCLCLTCAKLVLEAPDASCPTCRAATSSAIRLYL